MTQAPAHPESVKESAQHQPGQMLRDFVSAHPASRHALFAQLERGHLTPMQAGSLLRNYDAHASHLRRLLLKAATIMPECAVGFILENVRNEYGNGIAAGRHQLQLQDLAWQIGLKRSQYDAFTIQPGIRKFIKDVGAFYYPLARFKEADVAIKSRAAIASGAITATELLAVEEFKSLQKAFTPFGLKDHIWFDHVTIECEHLEDSVNLALYFLQEAKRDLQDDVLLGLKGVLDANMHLYDGLLACTAL
ncbi:MAG: iron-containing redox enzyme family protein [Cyanobacteria bacterium REEB67]|nr:iron-containing redox enzyme family protein [Cyanobacteria bacterium REEB67]